MVSRGSQSKGDQASGRSVSSRRAGENSLAVRRASPARATALVAFGALLQAVVVPYLTFGLAAPALALMFVVVATAGLKGVVALPLGFFGGILVDALGSGLFGVGAISGVMAAALSHRVVIAAEGAAVKVRLAGVVAAVVVVHDLASVAAHGLSETSWPPILELVATGVLPDAALNAVLAYVLGGALLRLVLVREKSWT